MTIKTIKEFAYSTQQHLLTQTGSNFKRTHIYELLAAMFGFNSYAALSAETVFTQQPMQDLNHFLLHTPAIKHRCIELGYEIAVADIASSELPAFITEHHVDIVRFDDLVSDLRYKYQQLDRYADWDDEDGVFTPYTDWDGEFSPYTDYLDGEFSPILLDGLETAARKGNTLAHYALALIYYPDKTVGTRKAGSPYWYSQAQQGHVLTAWEKEWADMHAKYLADTDKYAFHLREAGRLGNEHALLDLAERFDDPVFFEKINDTVDEDPIRIAEIAEGLGRMQDARHWLTIAAEAGDIEAMRRLIEEFDYEDQQQCWIWIYLARLLETDLTKDDYYAIYEGGNMYLDGQGGVELALLNAEQDAVAQQSAKELFKRIEMDG